MSITIDLNHTQTDKFEESEFLHHEARVKFLTAIDTSLELLNSELKEKRVHNSILINGKRGYGKTSFILTMQELLKKEYKEKLLVLDIIDPTIVETKENIFILVLTIIKQKVEKFIKNPCADISQRYKRDFEESLKKLATGLSVLDGVGGSTLFKESIWNESELILEDALHNTKGGNELEKNFKEFIELSLEILGKEAFILVFDDIDTAANQGEMILELIRKYFTSARLFVVLLGDVELFNLIVRNMQWKKLSPTYIKTYEEKLIEDLYGDEIDTLTQQYIIKVLRSENIIPLKRVHDISESIEILNGGNLKSFVTKEIIEKIFKEKNNTKIVIFQEFLLRLPLRSVIQILKSGGDIIVLKHVLFSDIKTNYTKNLSEMLESFYNLQNDKYYLLYRYITSFEPQKFDPTFLPQTNDHNKNSLNILLNAHISHGTKSLQDMFDYFVKFYMPLNFGTTYDNNTHSFKIARYFIKDLRKNSPSVKLQNATIAISNDEFKKLELSSEDQALFNIFTSGLFTNTGLKNYFNFWNLFGFISDLFYYKEEIDLDKLLQIKSFYKEESKEEVENEQTNHIQEVPYDTTSLRGVCIALNTRFNILNEKALDVNLSARQLSSIWTRVRFAIKYIDDNPSARLSEQLQRYIQAILNAFIIVTLENEREIKFNNALSLNSPIFKENIKTLKKHDDKYLWLVDFVELGIWDILNEFSKKLDSIILTFDFNNEFSTIEFEGALKEIKEAILKNPKEVYRDDIARIVRSIKQRKTIDQKLANKLIKELEKIKENAKIKSKNDDN